MSGQEKMEGIRACVYNPFRSRGEMNAGVMNRLEHEGHQMHPVFIEPGVPFVTGLWGRGWYSAMRRNDGCGRRMSKARAMVRLGNVINFEITRGGISAEVIGSKMAVRHVSVVWPIMADVIRGKLHSLGAGLDVPLEFIAHGNLSPEVRQRILAESSGLFPRFSELLFSCTCDSPAVACRHCLAVLYALGVVMDREPASLFELWGFDGEELAAVRGNGGWNYGSVCGGGVIGRSAQESLVKKPCPPYLECVSIGGEESASDCGVWNGDGVGKLRKALKKTQKEFASQLGVSATTVSFWENGRLRVAEEYEAALSSLAADVPAWTFCACAGLDSRPTAGSCWDGSRVKALRHAMGVSLMDFAVKLQVSLGTVSNWEHGRFPVSRRAIPLLTELENGVSQKNIEV